MFIVGTVLAALVVNGALVVAAFLSLHRGRDDTALDRLSPAVPAGRLRSMLGPGAVLAVGALLAATVHATAAEGDVGLGNAASYAVLGGAGVTNTGPSVITGDLGSCPTPAITGFGPGVVLGGTIHANDAHACAAQADAQIAYDDAAGRAPTDTFAGPTDLVGLTLTPGVYNSPSSFANSGTLTLDGQGNPDAVFIFQAGSTLVTAPGSDVVVLNGAQACNVFWQVGSSATLGVSSTFVGTILALAAISANTDAFIIGRLLARTASVTLDSNIITSPICAAAVTTTTAGGGGTTSTTIAGGGGTTSTTIAGGGGTTSTTIAGLTTVTTAAPSGGGGPTFTVPGGGLPATPPSDRARVTPPNETARGAPPLAFGGAHIRWVLSAAVIAFMLGGLLIVLAGPEPPRRRPSGRS